MRIPLPLRLDLREPGIVNALVSVTILRRSSASLLLLMGGYVCLSTGGALGEGLMCLAPALALACLLLARRYPGEHALIARSARPRTRRARPRSSRQTVPRPVARLPRGGLLIGFSLAVRPPPLALRAS